MPKTYLPVLLNFDQNVIVGRAKIHEDGDITIEVKGNLLLGKDIHRLVELDQIVNFSLGLTYKVDTVKPKEEGEQDATR